MSLLGSARLGAVVELLLAAKPDLCHGTPMSNLLPVDATQLQAGSTGTLHSLSLRHKNLLGYPSGCNRLHGLQRNWPPLPLRLCRVGASQLIPLVHPAMPMAAIIGAAKGSWGKKEGRRRKERGARHCWARHTPETAPGTSLLITLPSCGGFQNFLVQWIPLDERNTVLLSKLKNARSLRRYEANKLHPPMAPPPRPASSTNIMPPASQGGGIGGAKPRPLHIVADVHHASRQGKKKSGRLMVE